MSFTDDLRRFQLEVEARGAAVFIGVVAAAKESVVLGSPITGSPGQPVETGALRASWTESFLSAERAQVTTNQEYAPPIEDGVGPHGPLQLRSEVGGFGSVAKTVAGWPRLVDHVTRQVTGANP
jgi:hypothetical protein